MFVVFDLDGTLALNEHRQHYVQRPVGEKDWDSFFDACDKDLPNWPIIRVLLACVARGDQVEIWSGRTSRVQAKTQQWLTWYDIGYIPLRCRKEGDHTPDAQLKESWIKEYGKPDLVFDDRKSVVDMWRSHGIVCYQVAPGEF